MFQLLAENMVSKSRRGWSVLASTAGEIAVVGFALLLPAVAPDALSLAGIATRFGLPQPPPGPPPRIAARPDTARVPKTKAPRQFQSGLLTSPASVPDKVPTIIDGPEIQAAASDWNGGVPGGLGPSVDGRNALDAIWRMPHPAPPPKEPSRPQTPAAKPPAPVPVGGKVQEAKIIRRVIPEYPPPAIRMHIEGVVKLQGIIGVDGRIQALQVISGHPFLTRAALEAVRQWEYRPTYLNGVPVEVVAPIDVIFRLRR